MSAGFHFIKCTRGSFAGTPVIKNNFSAAFGLSSNVNASKVGFQGKVKLLFILCV